MRFPPHFQYLKEADLTWFNPCWGYHGFWKRLLEFQQERKLDSGAAWSHRGMKRNKELYASAIAALCMHADAPTKYGWWFTKPPQDPPDGLIGTVFEDDSINGNMMMGREVEIVEYLEGSVAEAIRNKLLNKSYEPNTLLVCLLSPQGFAKAKVFDFPQISKQLRSMNLPLAHVFLAGHGFQVGQQLRGLSREKQIEEMAKILFVQLLPKYGIVSISPYAACQGFQTGQEQAWLKFTKLGRGMGLEKVTVPEAPRLFD